MLDWVGEPCDFVDVEGFDAPGPALDLLLTVNPLARVPTLILSDGQILIESAAIALHLAEFLPEAELAPPSDGNLATSAATPGRPAPVILAREQSPDAGALKRS